MWVRSVDDKVQSLRVELDGRFHKLESRIRRMTSSLDRRDLTTPTNADNDNHKNLAVLVEKQIALTSWLTERVEQLEEKNESHPRSLNGIPNTSPTSDISNDVRDSNPRPWKHKSARAVI